MEDLTPEITERFERYCSTTDNELPPEILGELSSMLRLYSISPEELDFKWQAYSMKLGMGAEETKLDLKTARDFKKNLQDTLERESRGKAAHARTDAKRGAPTPRAGMKSPGDVFGMYVSAGLRWQDCELTVCRLDGLVPNTPRPGARNGVNGSTVKRKSNFETPGSKASKSHEMSSPGGMNTPKGELNGGAYVTHSVSSFVLLIVLAAPSSLLLARMLAISPNN
jgi:DNA polymerase alpha subunit B